MISNFLRAAALPAVILAACTGAAWAQDKYPHSTVVMATHSSPGGGSDVFLREMAPHLSRIMGVNFVVKNIRGGAGAKAMAEIAAAKPDGSIFYATTPTFINTSLMSKPPKTYKDLEPLVNVFFDPEVIFTAADSRFASMADAFAHAKSGQGKWGASSPASLERQVMEQLKTLVGVNAIIATFDGGGDMMINVLNKTLDIGIGEVQELRAQLEAKKVRLLAVVGDRRLEQFPDVPTLKQQGADIAVLKFRGLAGPKGQPANVVAAWEKGIQALLADPQYKKIYLANNLQAGYMSHAEYARFIDSFGRDTEAFLKSTGVIK